MSKEKGKAATKKPDTFERFMSEHFGRDSVIPASALVARPRRIVPTVLSLDIALSGGIPEGLIALFSGKPKGGKTSLCLQILANGIRLGRPAYYFNVERRLKPSLIETISGLDRERLCIVESNRDHTFNAQGWLQALERTIKDHPGVVVVVDSIAAMCTQAEQAEATGDNKDMSGVPKLLSSFFRKMQDIVDLNDAVLIFLSQEQTNRDPMSKRKYDEKGGMGVQYACSVWLNLSWFQLWPKDPESNSPLGQDAHFVVKASALGRPYIPCVVPLRFGAGIDRPRDVATQAENLGLMEKSGSWYCFPMLDGARFQGLGGVREFFLANPEAMHAVEREVRRAVIPVSVPYADQIAGWKDGLAAPAPVSARTGR